MKKEILIKEDITNYAYKMILEFINRVIININMLGVLDLSSLTNPLMANTINENLELLKELLKEFEIKKIIEIDELIQVKILLPFKFKNIIKKISIYSIDFSIFFNINMENKILSIKDNDNIYTKDYNNNFQVLTSSCLNLKNLIEQLAKNNL
jgi:hypothetical protein